MVSAVRLQRAGTGRPKSGPGRAGTGLATVLPRIYFTACAWWTWRKIPSGAEYMFHGHGIWVCVLGK